MRPAHRLSDARFGAALALAYLVFSAVFWAYPFVWLLILSVFGLAIFRRADVLGP